MQPKQIKKKSQLKYQSEFVWQTIGHLNTVLLFVCQGRMSYPIDNPCVLSALRDLLAIG